MTHFRIVLIVVATFVVSCNQRADTAEKVNEPDGNSVRLTEQQRKSANLEIGTITMRSMSQAIPATGMLDVPPQNMISVSPPLGGFVKNTELLQGMRVKKGAVLIELEHPDYIQLQQDYLGSRSQLEFLEAEYKRQTELAKENINAQKSLQESKAHFESMKANVDGLRAKLGLLNITDEQLQRNGISRTIRLYAPVGGYITEVNVNVGSYATPADVMIRLVNTEHLHAELKVFENDIPKIKLGQIVKFNLINDTTTHLAEVYLIGRQVLSDRTVSVHCHLEKEDTELIPGMFIKAKIESEQHDVPVLPDEAIVSHEGKRYVFIEGEQANTFDLIPVTTLGQEGGYTAVTPTSTLTPETKIVIRGAHTLLSMKFNTEEE